MENDKPKSGAKKMVIWAVVSLALAVLTIRAVFALSKNMSFPQMMDLIAGANPVLLLLGAVSAGLYVWLEGIALRSILVGTGYPRRRRKCLFYSTADVYFSAITPSATGGQPASAFFMVRDGIPTGVASAVLVVNLIMYTLSIITLGFVAVLISPHVFFDFDMPAQVLIVIGFTALTVLAVFFLNLLRNGDKVFKMISGFISSLREKGIMKRGERTIARMERASRDYEEVSNLIAGKRKVLFKAFFWNLLQRASQIMTPVFLYLSLGGRLRLAPEVFAKQCLITIGYNFVPIPGGMGISDYLMVDGFQELMGEELAFSFELLSRSITFYICVSLSGLITLLGYIIVKRRSQPE